MRQRGSAVLAALALTLCAAAVDAGYARAGAMVAPVEKFGGLTGGELLRESWKRELALPADNRFRGHCLPLLEGRVLMPFPREDGVALCSARRDTRLFVRFGASCSNVEDPPFFGADEAAQQACARAYDQGMEAMSVTVDHGPTIDVHTPRFELLSPQGRVRLPEDNILGVPPQTATFAAHAWGGLVSELGRGQHTITFEIVHAEFGFTVSVIVDVA